MEGNATGRETLVIIRCLDDTVSNGPLRGNEAMWQLAFLNLSYLVTARCRVSSVCGLHKTQAYMS